MEPDYEFLVTYDDGFSVYWAVLMAPSAEEILSKYPELVIAERRPDGMNEDDYVELRSRALWLDQPPAGILVALLEDRDR